MIKYFFHCIFRQSIWWELQYTVQHIFNNNAVQQICNIIWYTYVHTTVLFIIM